MWLCCWPLKFGPQKIEGKMEFAAKKRIALVPQNVVVVLVDEKKDPQKIVFYPQNVKGWGGQSGGISISISPNKRGVPSSGPTETRFFDVMTCDFMARWHSKLTTRQKRLTFAGSDTRLSNASRKPVHLTWTNHALNTWVQCELHNMTIHNTTELCFQC